MPFFLVVVFVLAILVRILPRSVWLRSVLARVYHILYLLSVASQITQGAPTLFQAALLLPASTSEFTFVQVLPLVEVA